MHANVFIEQYYDAGLFHNKGADPVWWKMDRMDIPGGVSLIAKSKYLKSYFPPFHQTHKWLLPFSGGYSPPESIDTARPDFREVDGHTL